MWLVYFLKGKMAFGLLCFLIGFLLVFYYLGLGYISGKIIVVLVFFVFLGWLVINYCVCLICVWRSVRNIVLDFFFCN